ncbi:unnamed protein product [Clavelina lepadiformis]|uniref:Glycolipid transfer protein domain-containing protein n=2 Tax=Clavelina lepadiformis TaxID=159417 RepID=A0ABP0GFH6_CLALP
MAFYVRHWLKVQTRRCMQGMFNAFQVYSLCSVLKRRMKNSIAYCILGTLAIIVVLSAFRCSGGPYTTNIKTIHSNEKSVEEFMSAVREKEAQLDSKTTNMGDECPSKGENTFSAANMSVLFQECAKSKRAREVDMDHYLAAWDELIRFLNSMGKAFSFVSSDVVDKVGILRAFRNSADASHYETIKKMIVYEKNNNLINYKEAPSKKVKAYGSRTLLRLHRALKFLLILIGKLARNEDEGKVSVMGYNAYHASPMAEYHPWIVRKAVGLAVYMLPDRPAFIKQLCQDMSEEELAKSMQVCSESMDAIFEYTHALYSKYEVLEIP